MKYIKISILKFGQIVPKGKPTCITEKRPLKAMYTVVKLSMQCFRQILQDSLRRIKRFHDV